MADKLSQCLSSIQKEIKKICKKSLDVKKLDELLSTQCKTEGDRMNILKQLNLIDVYQSLITKYTWKGNFNSEEVDKLIKWQYNSDEEIKQVKLTIGSMDVRYQVTADSPGAFIRQELYSLWKLSYANNKRDPKKSEIECLKFLKWFFETEEEINLYRKEKLVKNKNFLKEFTQGCFNWEFVDEFFKFCLVTPEKVKNIKKSIRQNLEDWIEHFALKQHSVRKADEMVTWIYPDKKDKIIKKFLHSDNAPYIIAMVVNNLCGKVYNKNIMILFNKWIKGKIQIDKVRSALSDCDYNMLKSRYICLLDAFLDILEKGKEIKNRDIDICTQEYLIDENLQYVHNCDDENAMENDLDSKDEDSDSEDEDSGSEDEDSDCEDTEDIFEDEDMPEDVDSDSDINGCALT